MKNIVLIGMMGCGKSTCGKLLSQRLGLKLVDTDELIVEREGRSISQIFAAEGEESFRNMETRVIRELTGWSGLVIATGGGLPLREENAKRLREMGLVVWLKRDPASTFSSVSMAGRPLAQSGQTDFLARFREREPLYRRAAHVVIEDFSAPENTVDLIVKVLKGEATSV